jgi:two-component system, OmpR family, sensor histidine kinase KdpD
LVVKDTRPNPDELLSRLKVEAEQAKKGKLKIFLGYAAGVGKTYTMLEAARQRRKELDIVIAYVETHGRTDTEALVEGFEIVPRKQVQYRGVNLTEMDLDAVLERKPKLALVDELAHTNATGSRHPKRYLDVEELLDAGIDVYTTLNVQHIESLRNVVAQITGVWIRETIPDSIIDKANEIELVDLPPEELLKRLKEGKVYIPAQIANAIDKFFQKGNLTSLRELSMRIAAERVDEDKRAFSNVVPHGMTSLTEKVMACISPTPLGTRLVRSARRLAFQLGAEWYAVYVDTPGTKLATDQQNRLTSTLRLAEKLGARIITLRRDSVVPAINEFAAENKITKMVVGNPQKRSWRNPFAGSLVNKIIAQNPSYDLYVVGGSADFETPEQSQKEKKQPRLNWRGYALGLGLVVLATLIGELGKQILAPTVTILIFLLCVVITAIVGGLGPSILTAILGVLAFDFFLIPPYLSLDISDAEYLFAAIVLLGIGIVVSYLTSRIRQQTEIATQRERQTAALFDLSRELAVSSDLETYIHAIQERIRKTFKSDSVVFLPDGGQEEKLKAYGDGTESVGENESAAAFWSFQHQKIVGRGTDTLPNDKARYLPLVTARKTVGVIAVQAIDSGTEFTLDQERLLEAYADLAAVAIEGIQLAEEAHSAQILRDTEKLQTALLNSITHDLRTPLVSIIGVLSSLQEEGMNLDDTDKKNLVQVAREEAERLNRLITNLLDESRIEAGALQISKQPSEVQDVIGAALEQIGSRAATHEIKIEIEPELPYLSIDFGLIVQTLTNILDNAIKFSAAGSLIEISARRTITEVVIEVADRGVGVPAQDLTRIFDKFYLVQHPSSLAGTGLGLSICKGIIEAHGGRISAENRQGGGTIMKLMLPIAEQDSSLKTKAHE